MGHVKPVQDEDNASVYCRVCRAYRAGIARGMYDTVNFDGDIGTRFTLLECNICTQPIVGCRVCMNAFIEPLTWGEFEQMYPPVEGEALDHAIPSEIADAYRQAKRVFTVNSFDSVALMCRKAIELMCNELDAIGTDLKKKLAYLKGAGVIDDRIHEWSDQILREIGNDAAHSGTVSKEDAKDAIEFTKAIMDYLFVFMPAFQNFKGRHSKE